MAQPTPTSPATVVTHAITGVAAFAITVFVLHWLLPLALSPLYRLPQAAEFDEMAGRVDVLFVGSSRVLRQVDPLTFDRVTAAAGHPTTSFNLGMAAATVPESLTVLEQVLSGPNAVKVVVFEPATGLRLMTENALSRRSLHFHSPRNAVRSAQFEWTSDRKPVERALAAAEAGMMNATNRGRLSAVLFDEQEMPEREYGLRGWAPLDDAKGEEFEKLHLELLENRHRWPAMVKKRDRIGSRAKPLSPAHLAMLLEVRRTASEAGVKLIWLAPPHGSKADWNARAYKSHLRGDLPGPFLAFNDRTRIEGALDASLWFDVGHLNRAGSTRFSAVLGRAYLDAGDAVP
jgi:hypothetical protein